MIAGGASALPVSWAVIDNVAKAAANNLSAPNEELVDAINLMDFKRIARQHIDPKSFAFVTGGAGDEITLAENRMSYDRIRLRPRVLVDVSNLDTKVSLFGEELSHPILLAPAGLHRQVHPDGEIATVKGAGIADATMVISMYANTRVEEIARAATKPVWFQLYLQKDRGFTREMVQRAEEAGCRAICLTVDAPVMGARNRQDRAGFRPRHGIPNLWGHSIVRTEQELRKGSIYNPLLLSTMTWDDVDWLLSFTRVPVLLKGVLNPDDADRAMSTGVAGIIVSNHGGRMLDTVPATIDALPRIADKIAGRKPVLIDGGIRRGTDVLKALANGASAVLIGRPYLYGLGIGGAEGVTKAVAILHREFRMAMALTGRTSIKSIDRSVLW
jgi:4-hydroxymandelate oxidase